MAQEQLNAKEKSETFAEIDKLPVPPATPDDQQRPQLSEESKKMQSEWEKYFAGLGDDYMKNVTTLAKRKSYKISLRKKTGNKTTHPITGAQVDEYKGWEEKEFDRNKIASEDWHMAEKMRAENGKEKDDVKFRENLAKIYEFLAWCYLGMTHDEFNRADWNDIKPIIDACNHRTVYSLPN